MGQFPYLKLMGGRTRYASIFGGCPRLTVCYGTNGKDLLPKFVSAVEDVP